MAIVRDAHLTWNGTGTSVVSGNITISGNKIFVQSIESTTNTIVSVKIGATAFTQIQTTQNVGAGNTFLSHWYLDNPPTGLQTITVTYTDGVNSKYLETQSYSGAATGIDNSTVHTGTAAGTSWATSLTPVANNCWINMAQRNTQGGTTGDANTTVVLADMWDNNAHGAITPAASYTMTVSVTASGRDFGVIMASFAPSTINNSAMFAFF